MLSKRLILNDQLQCKPLADHIPGEVRKEKLARASNGMVDHAAMLESYRRVLRINTSLRLNAEEKGVNA